MANGNGGIVLEIDSGMRFLLKSDDLKTTYAIIYAPPDRDPPSGFTSGNVYYYVEQEIPSSATDLQLVSDDQPPGFDAGDAVSSPTVGYTDQTSPPASSDTLWVFRVEQSWALDWKLRNTGTSVTGSVTWWNETGAPLSLRTGTYPIVNNTSVTSNTTWSAADEPTAPSRAR